MSGCTLHFSDNGMGMPEDVRQKIFEPFFSTKGAHGTGLGLSVSYSIIERHAGSISVVSEPGKGTTSRSICLRWLRNRRRQIKWTRSALRFRACVSSL